MAASNKFGILILAVVALISIVVLSAGISELELSPGQRFQIAPESAASEDSLISRLAGPDFARLFVLINNIALIVLLPLALIWFIFNPEARRGMTRYLRSLLIILALYIVFTRLPRNLLGFDEIAPPQSGLPPADGAAGVMSVALTGPPEWLVVLAGFVTFLVVLVSGWFVYDRFLKPDPLQRIAQEAQEALDDIYAGADLTDTIKRCYYEMSQVLNARHGFRRAASMTPREFERRLRATGLPHDHIEQLTRLFENVRYGATSPTQEQELLAVDCLTAIAKAADQPA